MCSPKERLVWEERQGLRSVSWGTHLLKRQEEEKEPANAWGGGGRKREGERGRGGERKQQERRENNRTWGSERTSHRTRRGEAFEDTVGRLAVQELQNCSNRSAAERAQKIIWPSRDLSEQQVREEAGPKTQVPRGPI